MAIIQAYDPTEAEFMSMERIKAVRKHALTLLEDDGGLLGEALSETTPYDEKARMLLTDAVRARIKGEHPDLLPVAVEVVKLIANYYLDVADRDYDGDLE